ncbi:hemerythrin domain-containing protein [Luteimicrobium sp. DT211]|uniref:hemerythrin domain-containing protein n=1 Tax=Luteimicrobium sp. DT211 TaxID=3393412 RepID=UPI003CECE7A3
MDEFYVAARGESAPPVPDGPLLCDGRDMRIVHNAFLWGYQQAPGLVRDVSAGDTDRSAFVGRWLGDLDATLHVHHEGEDQLLWVKLEQRAPACALHVGQMRAQHAQVQDLLHRAAPLLADWTRTADPATGEALAGEYEHMLEVLSTHLRREVVEVVPVAEKVLSQEEWEQLAEHGMGAIPRSRLMPQLGMLLANTPVAERAGFVDGMPRPVRVMYRMFGRRQFEKQYRLLFPDRPVPQTP